MNSYNWLPETMPAILAQITSDLAECVGSRWAVAMSALGSDLLPIYTFGRHPDLAACVEQTESALKSHELTAENFRNQTAQITCPVRLDGDVFAALVFGPKDSGIDYSAQDRGLIGRTVAHLSFLLSDGRMAVKLGANVSQLQRTKVELASAREVQGRLFPYRHPSIPGLDYYGESRPAGELGGDFFDFAASADLSLLFTIGDVSGKGVPAAIVMAGLLASLRALTAGSAGNLSTLVRDLNRMIWEVSPDYVYATMFHACIDSRRRELRYVNAAHDAVVLLRSNLKRVVRLETTGTVLGLGTKAVYEQRSVPFESGDVLVAVTDGITEASDPEGRVLDERVISTAVKDHPNASSSELAGYIIRAVDSFAGGQEPNDDRTVVVVRFNGVVAETFSSTPTKLHAFAHAA